MRITQKILIAFFTLIGLSSNAQENRLYFYHGNLYSQISSFENSQYIKGLIGTTYGYESEHQPKGSIFLYSIGLTRTEKGFVALYEKQNSVRYEVRATSKHFGIPFTFGVSQKYKNLIFDIKFGSLVNFILSKKDVIRKAYFYETNETSIKSYNKLAFGDLGLILRTSIGYRAYENLDLVLEYQYFFDFTGYTDFNDLLNQRGIVAGIKIKLQE